MNTLSAPEETATFLETLRSNTRDEHSKLEELPVSKSIVSENLTINQYALYLQLMYLVVAQIEESVFPVLTDFVPDMDLRYKLHWIESDLNCIGAEIPEKTDVFRLPQSVEIGFALGVAYVIEGSTLGGRYILNNVSQVLNLTPENGASYFAGYQNATGSRWKDFLATLQKFASENNHEHIIGGARFAFSSIYKQMNHD